MSNHGLGCRCWQCLAQVLGIWLDELGQRTKAGAWQIFLTITYASVVYPWARGFPGSGGGIPSSEFGHHCFDDLVSHLEAQLGARVDYIMADQYGSVNGRFHQHALLAAIGLDRYPRPELERCLRKRVGWSRALPFQHGAAYYLARYIGRNLESAEWTVRVGGATVNRDQRAIGREVVAKSADVPRALFHQTLKQRKR